jgi:hypothetical protein
LAVMCMYDYVSGVYKSSDAGGLPFDTSHPQYLTYDLSTVCSEGEHGHTYSVGKALFLRPDSDDEVAGNDHFCIVSALFIPWSNVELLQKPADASWGGLFSFQIPFMSARLLRNIDNLVLLHKSKAEAHIDSSDCMLFKAK